MKKFVFWGLMVASLLSITSCSNESKEQDDTRTALTISISGSNVKATTSMSPSDLLAHENEIKNMEVLVFSKVSNAKEVQQTITGTTGTVNNLTIGQKRVVVVANPSAALKSQLSAVTTYSELNDPTKVNLMTISQTETTGLRNTTNGFTMVGEDSGVTLVAGSSNTTTITVERVVAKVQLGTITIAPAAGYDASKFALSKVHVQKVRSKTLIGKPAWQITDNTQFQWLGGTTQNASVTTTADTRFTGTLASSGTTVTTNNKDFFYVVPNDNTGNNCTLLAIEGTYDGVTQFFVFRINDQAVPSQLETGNFIKNNRHYTLNVTLKRLGDGSVDPDVPSDPATLDVTVQVANWVVVPTQSVEW